jgi:hypothetical protein
VVMVLVQVWVSPEPAGTGSAGVHPFEMRSS